MKTLQMKTPKVKTMVVALRFPWTFCGGRVMLAKVANVGVGRADLENLKVQKIAF